MYPGKDDGVMLDRERFLGLLDAYYALSGWDRDQAWPTPAKLQELGLGDVAAELGRVGRLKIIGEPCAARHSRPVAGVRGKV